MDKYITEEQLAERLQVSRTLLWALRKAGLPHCRVGRVVRYSESEVAGWLKGNSTRNTVSSEDPKGEQK